MGFFFEMFKNYYLKFKTLKSTVKDNANLYFHITVYIFFIHKITLLYEFINIWANNIFTDKVC